MADVEIIEFKIPHGSTTLLYLPQVIVTGSLSIEQVYRVLFDYFSKWGLLYNLTVTPCEEAVAESYCYLRYYSSRAASIARRDNRGHMVVGEEEKVMFKLASHVTGGAAVQLPLAKYKCEELANYYLGFNGWSSCVLYHKREEVGEKMIRVVSIVKLNFVKVGLSCEGAGKFELDVDGDELEALRIVGEVGKRARGEAMQAAWSKVVLIVVGGKKVCVEINTTKSDAFLYDPLWDDPVVTVQEADYFVENEVEPADSLPS